MKALIEQYLLDQNILQEPYSIQFLRFTTNIYKDNDGYHVEFPKWHFPCPKPTFTSQEIEDTLKNDYIESHTDGINNKYSGDETTKQSKLDELNSLNSLEDIKDYIY